MPGPGPGVGSERPLDAARASRVGPVPRRRWSWPLLAGGWRPIPASVVRPRWRGRPDHIIDRDRRSTARERRWPEPIGRVRRQAPGRHRMRSRPAHARPPFIEGRYGGHENHGFEAQMARAELGPALSLMETQETLPSSMPIWSPRSQVPFTANSLLPHLATHRPPDEHVSTMTLKVADAALGLAAGPGGPTGPCGPAGPGRPSGPTGPVSPAEPTGPAGPGSPRMPCGPCAPCGPCWPGTPIGPC